MIADDQRVDFRLERAVRPPHADAVKLDSGDEPAARSGHGQLRAAPGVREAEREVGRRLHAPRRLESGAEAQHEREQGQQDEADQTERGPPAAAGGSGVGR